MSDILTSNDAEVEVVSADAISTALVALSSGNISSDVFSTFDSSKAEQADTVWRALSDSEPVKQNIGKDLEIHGLVILRVELLNEQTGEVQSQPRCVFVTAAGEAFHVTSPVVLRDIRTMIALKGQPTAANPVHIRFEEGGSGTRKFVTLKPAKGKR